MKNLRFIVVVAILTVSLLAQESQAQVYYMVVDHVKPSKQAQYEATSIEYTEFLKTNEFEFSVDAYRSRDLHYYYVTPIEPTFAELDSIMLAYGKLADKDEEGYKRIFSGFNDTYFDCKTMCYYFSEGLSYVPEEPALSDEEMICYELWTIQVRLGQAQNLNKLLKEYKALCKENNVPYPSYVYSGLIGMDQGTYMLVTPGKDPADIWESNVKTREMLGDEVKTISSRLMELLDEMEVTHIWWQEKLSYKLEK